MVIRVAARSDIGCHREKNEDSFYTDVDNGLYVICDGMGGHLAGEIASQSAIEFVVEFFAKARRRRLMPRKADSDFREVWSCLVVEAIEKCCDELVELATSHPEYEGMATTITVLLVVEGVAFVGYLGDSRLYLMHGDVAKQLTHDHTLFEEFNRANPSWVETNNDPESLQRFRHILTRCVGRAEKFCVDNFHFQLADDDILLLCTDGLSNYFDDEETVLELLSGENTDEVVDSLIEFANSNGGRDNITAIVVRVVSLEDSEFDESVVRPDMAITDTSDTGLCQVVVIETNSCPSGQKSMPRLNESIEKAGYDRLLRDSFLEQVGRRKGWS